VLNIAALALAAATAATAATQSPSLVSTNAWWEKVTVTITGDGTPRACSYETSSAKAEPSDCAIEGAPEAIAASEGGPKSQLTKITFERRFVPSGTRPTEIPMQPGDTLLGGQVMALAIDNSGAVANCEIVAKSGDMTPSYGCDEAQTEKFEASAGHAASHQRQGYMMVIVYGHEEQVV